MLFTIFCCISTALCVFCILNRINKRTVEIAVHAAVHEAKKEFHERNSAVFSQLATKERELAKARELVKLHEAVPTMTLPKTARAGAAPAKPVKRLPQDPLNVFEMSRPFTDTSYDALLANSDVVKVEPSAM
jgi:hypothetical protein